MVESDVFSCFSIFMMEMKDNFFTEGENENGDKMLNAMKIRVSQLSDLFKKIDYKLYNHLEELKIQPALCCIKWFMHCLL